MGLKWPSMVALRGTCVSQSSVHRSHTQTLSKAGGTWPGISVRVHQRGTEEPVAQCGCTRRGRGRNQALGPQKSSHVTRPVKGQTVTLFRVTILK